MRKIVLIVLLIFVLIFIAYLSIASYIKKMENEKQYSQFIIHQSQVDSLLTNHFERDYINAIAYSESLITNIQDELSYIENSFVFPYYIDMLFLTHQYNRALNKCLKWEYLVSKYESLEFKLKQQSHLIGLMNCYYYLDDYENLDKTFEAIEKDNFTNEVFFFADFSEQLVLKWYLKILVIYIKDNNSAKDIINHFDYLSLYLINAQIMANENINDAIKYIKKHQILFNKDCMSPEYRQFVRYEESNMLLAYLYFKNKEIDNALHYFKNSLIKEEGSTFNGNWNEWLNYRNYYRDEYEVLIKLKDTYIKE